MTITFPRALPEPFPWRDCKFLQTYQQARAPTRGGGVQVANIGREYWSMRYQTRPLDEKTAAGFEAWLSSLRGGARVFKAWHPLREYPLNYAAGFGGLNIAGTSDPFVGSGVLDSVSGPLDSVTVSGLPSGFSAAIGDMLSFGYGSGGQSLHRVLEAVTATGLGVAVLPVEPTVPIGWSAAAPVLFEKPWCKAIIDAESIDVAWQLGRKAVVSFSAQQVH